ncbi:uncharacterized protein FIBRA_07374 [Fibroporia radiculosa]|uniref:Cytochrome P450 n=1 Tax=Fibroporia radiculosa TaxID=599839 RepID=J4GUT6_9APHY|nr:uncharacterized protein FIBRA_07374 [Fibroporia radiculosa]CCM05165.1 predicted protein [Fibroporia radiculosa]
MATVPCTPLLLCASLVCILYGCLVRRNARHLPPGPRASTFGSVALPTSYPWKTYAEWRKLYGDVIYIHIFGNPILILNTARDDGQQAVRRVSDTSLVSLSHRAPAWALIGYSRLHHTARGGSDTERFSTTTSTIPQPPTTIPYSPEKHMSSSKISSTRLTCLLTTYEGLYPFSEFGVVPYGLTGATDRTAAAIIMNIVYGHQVAPEGDNFVTLADKALATLAASGIFGTYLVDYIPLLRHVPRWMPGAGFKRQALEWRKLNQAMLNAPFDMVKERMKHGSAISALTTFELEKWQHNGQDPDEERIIKDVAATAYAAGADTTVSGVISFFLAMTIYPDVLKRAQAEIDQVVGPDRLPNFDDRISLLYVDWIVWECLRWNPVTPLGIAHSMTDDDEYEGYHIPKGTTVLPNVWGILHDETTYPDPLRFHPERYADAQVNSEQNINEIPWAAFGFGRRMCPGRWLAVDSLWIAVATICATFDISKALDEKGMPIEPDVEFTSTLLSRPKPFKCRITPRSQAVASLVEQSLEQSSI